MTYGVQHSMLLFIIYSYVTAWQAWKVWQTTKGSIPGNVHNCHGPKWRIQGHGFTNTTLLWRQSWAASSVWGSVGAAPDTHQRKPRGKISRCRGAGCDAGNKRTQDSLTIHKTLKDTIYFCNLLGTKLLVLFIIPSEQRSCWGVYWFHSVRLSVRLSVRNHFGYVAWEWWEFRWSNKWNWYSSGLSASILVWHTCASALSGWVLYRQLELTKLTRPDLHHVVGLFILKDVRPSGEVSGHLRRMHGGIGLKFYMLMYLDHLQNW